MSVKSLVEDVISSNKVVIYSKSWCPYSTKAKQLFLERYPDVETTIYELDKMDEGADIQAYLKDKTGQSSVPNIFINKSHIGGCDSVLDLQSKGKLAPLLKE